MYKNYIFDLYGTLVDINTDEEKMELWNKMAYVYKMYGIKYSPSKFKKLYLKFCEDLEIKLKTRYKCNAVEIPLEEVFKRFFYLKKMKPRDDAIENIMLFFRKQSTSYIKLYDGVLEVLEELKKKNKKIYLLSNAQCYFTIPEIEKLGIKDYFDGIVISSCEGYKKPDSKFYEVLFNRYGLKKEESVMIGNDSLCDIEGANAYGIDTFYINSNISPEYDKNKDVASTYKSFSGSVMEYLKILK